MHCANNFHYDRLRNSGPNSRRQQPPKIFQRTNSDEMYSRANFSKWFIRRAAIELALICWRHSLWGMNTWEWYISPTAQNGCNIFRRMFSNAQNITRAKIRWDTYDDSVSRDFFFARFHPKRLYAQTLRKKALQRKLCTENSPQHKLCTRNALPHEPCPKSALSRKLCTKSALSHKLRTKNVPFPIFSEKF